MAYLTDETIGTEKKIAIIVLNAESSAAVHLSGVFEALGADRAISPPAGKKSAVGLLNDEVMASAGYLADGWDSFHTEWLASPKVAQFVKKALKVIETSFEDSHLMLIDDVSTARLLPFWNIVFEKAKVVPRYVFVVEDPAELAEEFSKRLDREPRHSHLIWLRTALDAELHSRGRLRTFLDPVALGAQPASIMEKAAQTLDLVFPRKIRATTAANPSCLAALRGKALRAAQTSGFDAERVVSTDWVKVAHMTFSQWSAEGETDEGQYMLDAVREAFDDAVPAFQGVGEVAPGVSRQLREIEGKLEALELELDDARGELGDVRAELGDARAEIAIARAAEVSAKKQVEESDAAARKQQAGLKQRIAELESALAQHDDAARQQQAASKHRIAELESALAQNDADTRQQQDDLRHRIAYLESELAQRKAEVDDSERALQDARRRIASLDQEMATQRNAARQEVDILHQAIREANQAKGDAEEQLQERYREIVTLSRKLAIEAAAVETLKRNTERLKTIALAFEAGGARGRFASFLDMVMPWRWHMARIRRRMEKAGAFDSAAYLAANPDVAQAGMDPLKHYMAHGLDENRPLGTH
jgi:hypothetical protein